MRGKSRKKTVRFNHKQRTYTLFVFLLILLALSQVTRFENEIIVEYTGEEIIVELHGKNKSYGRNHSKPLIDGEFSKIELSFQKTMAGEGDGRLDKSNDGLFFFDR